MKQQPLQQQEEERRQSSPKQQMQQVQQPLQQVEPRQSPLQKGNQARKPLSKDEILNCVNGTEQDRLKYKPGAPMLTEENVKAAGPNCAKLHAYVMEHSKDKLAFPAKVDEDYYKGGCGALMLNIEFSSMYNLITMASLMLPS
jgi:membrane protein involved in colicin uptake